MSVDKTRSATGYPPVKESETRQAANNAVGTRASARRNPTRADERADERIVTDAIATVIERHRTEINAAQLSAETKRYAIDLLDYLYLDVLKTVLAKSSVLDRRNGRK